MIHQIDGSDGLPFWIDDQNTNVLRGAEALIERDRPVILCEYYPPLAELHGDDGAAHQAWFATHAYTLTCLGGDNYLGVPR